MPRSTLWKLNLGYVVVIALITVSVGTVVSNRIERDSLQTIEGSLLNSAGLLREIARPVLEDPRLPAPVVSRLQTSIDRLGDEGGFRVTVILPDGRVLVDSMEDPNRMDNHGDRSEVLGASVAAMGRATRMSATVAVEMMYVAIAVREDGVLLGYIRTAVSVNQVREQLAGARLVVFLGAAVMGLLTLLLGFYLMRQRTRPLSLRTEAAEFRAADERNRLAAILGSMAEGVIAVDANETIVHMNEAARGILEIEHSRPEGLPAWKILRTPRIAEVLTETIREDREFSEELQVSGRAGERRLELHSAPLLGERSSGAVLVLHDVTRLRSLESIRRDFVANVSHELKTPLAAIRGLVETILSDPQMEEATKAGFLQRMQQQTRRLSTLVSDLLALARFESQDLELELSEMDLRHPLRESVDAFRPTAQERQLKLDLRVPDDPVPVLGDHEALRQLFDNLLSNALKYTPEGGHVGATVTRNGLGAEVVIADTGVGMEPQHLPRIFERFYRVDKARSRELGGTGLGLSIVRHIVARLDGGIQVQSRPGQGTTVRVQLPTV